MKPLRGVIFDFDGTIADTFPICIEAFRRAAEPFRGVLKDEEILSCFGPSDEGAAKCIAPGHEAECLTRYYAEYDALHDSCKAPFTGVRELLEEIRSSPLQIGLVTAKGERTLNMSLRHIGLEGFFGDVETGCPNGPCKPEGILAVLHKWGVQLDEALYIGDAPSDVRAARQVGIRIGLATWAGGHRTPEALALKPDYVFNKVEELATWIRIQSAVATRP